MTSEPKRGLLAHLHPAILVGIFTLGWVVVELLGPHAGVSAYQVVWTRYATQIAAVLLIFGPRQKTRLIRSEQLGSQIFASSMMLGMPLCFVWAVSRISPADTLAVFWIAPFFIIALTALTGGTTGGVTTWVAAVAGFIGTILICEPDAGIWHHASIFAIGMAGCFALYMVTMSRIHRDPIPTKLFHTALWVFLSLSVALPLFWQTPTLHQWVAMIGIGTIGGISLYALDAAVDVASPAVLAPVLYTQMAWDVLLDWALHMAHPDVKAVVGTILAFAAALPALRWRFPSRTTVPGIST